MASDAVLAAERSEAVKRRTAAIAAYGERTGVEPPHLRADGKAKAGTPEWYVSETVLAAWQAEQLLRVQTELDAVNAELATVRAAAPTPAPTASKKGKSDA